jgi:hypothetical protein
MLNIQRFISFSAAFFLALHFIVFSMCSCATGVGVQKVELKGIDRHSNGVFENVAYKVHGAHYGSPT